MQIVHNAHDNFFRTSLSNVQVAKDFFQQHLPILIKQLLDFNSLRLQSGSYIEQSLKNLTSDILYKINYVNNENAAYLYVLAEHQSSVDARMPFRLLRYIVAIWGEHFKNNKDNKLPLVIPLVFYNGSQKYDGPKEMRELIAAPNELIEEFLFKPFHLIDTHDIEDETIRENYWSGLMTYVMKHAYEREMLNCVKQLSWLIKGVYAEGDINYITSALKYVLSRAKTQDPGRLLAQLKVELDDDGAIMSSVVEYLASKHKDVWLQQGMQQGIQQGMQQGEIALLMHLLERKFKVVPEHYRQKIEHAVPASLLKWGEMVLNSETLEEIFEP